MMMCVVPVLDTRFMGVGEYIPPMDDDEEEEEDWNDFDISIPSGSTGLGLRLTGREAGEDKDKSPSGHKFLSVKIDTEDIKLLVTAGDDDEVEDWDTELGIGPVSVLDEEGSGAATQPLTLSSPTSNLSHRNSRNVPNCMYVIITGGSVFREQLAGFRKLVNESSGGTSSTDNSKSEKVVPTRYRLNESLKGSSHTIIRYPKPSTMFSLKDNFGQRLQGEVQVFQQWLVHLVDNRKADWTTGEKALEEGHVANKDVLQPPKDEWSNQYVMKIWKLHRNYGKGGNSWKNNGLAWRNLLDYFGKYVCPVW